MSDIAALEGRITAALDRIRSGLDQVAAAAPAGGDASAALQDQLDEERTANAQLVERVRALKEAQDGRMANLKRGSRRSAPRCPSWMANCSGCGPQTRICAN